MKSLDNVKLLTIQQFLIISFGVLILVGSLSVSFADTPRQQLENGVDPRDIQCRESLILFLRDNGGPVCIMYSSIESFVERQWGIAAPHTYDTLPPRDDTPTKREPIPESPPIKANSPPGNPPRLSGPIYWTSTISNSTYTDSNGNTITISGGHETNPVDGGRPVYLIGSMLGITGEQFRDAFSYVTPEENGHLNEETAQANKAKLLGQLEQYGLTNDEIDRATNYYRYYPEGADIWPYTHAVLTATISNGNVISFEIVSGGDGYTSDPIITVDGYGVIPVNITISLTNTFATNGAITAIDADEYYINEIKSVHTLIEDADWRNGVTTQIQGEYLLITSNGIPDTDYSDIPDQNPHEIQVQNFNFKFPLDPEYVGEKIPTFNGPIGITLSGVAFFNMFDRDGNNANGLERFDSCNGHVAPRGIYHTHQLSGCFEDNESGHSKIFGFVFDGLPVYGYNGVNGVPPTDLDECNGHIDIGTYHYHATKTDPYLVGCFNGPMAITVNGY